MNKIAYENKISNVSYLQLHQKTNQIASKLISIGIENESRVLILIDSTSITIELIIALWKIGAVPILSNPNMTTAEVIQYCKKNSVNFLFSTNPRKLELNLKEFSVEALYSYSSLGIDFDKTNPSSMIILNSSGSTGYPKSVLHTLQNIYNSAFNTDNFENYSANDIFLSSLPIYHIGGLMIFFRSFFSGSKVIIPDSIKTTDLEKTIMDKTVTIVSLVPTQLQRLIHNDFTPPKNLRSVYIGGDFIQQELLSRAINLGWNIKVVYGSTETCSMISLLDCKKYPDKISSVGLPLNNSIIKIADDGEILLKSDSLLIKYYADEELTHKHFVDGYFKTGDFGRIDEDGFLFIDNRKRNFIISGGKNIDPIEVEKALCSIEKVSNAFVFPKDDSDWGQIVCAVIESDEILSSEEIKKKLAEIISSYKIPKRLKILKEIPRNKMGKFSANEIQKLFDKP